MALLEAPVAPARLRPIATTSAPLRRANPLSPAGRAWWSVAGLTVLMWGFRLFGYVDMYPMLSVAAVVLALWGLGTVVAVWLPRAVDPRVARVFAGVTLLLAVGGFVLWSYLQVVTSPSYGTDEIAFDQYAAQLFLHGVNPYTHSMAPAFSLFHVSPDGYTFHLDGRPVTSLSYPALSFLFYVPLLALGWSTQMAVAVNVLAWVVAMVLAFVLLPRWLRPLAIVVGSFSVYIAYAVGGVTDALFVPLVIGAVYRWDRFATERGPAAWRGPLLLGLAMAVKQTPWLVAPFLASGVGIEAYHLGGAGRAARTLARYVGLAALAFAAPNLPFVVMAPHAWLTGILTPIASHTVPAGQGLVGLTLFLGAGGGSLLTYTIALVVVFVSLWALYLVTYPSLKGWAVAIPALVLFFSARSFGSYLVTLLPAALVGVYTIRAGSVSAGHGRPVQPWRHWRWLAAGGIVLSAIGIAAIFTATAPLRVQITSVRTTGQLATVVQVGVQVTNDTDRAQRPAFTLESGGQITAFWLARGGPATLLPGSQAHYTLLAPNFFAQPPITGGFQVLAFTSTPGTVSVSTAYLPTTLHLSLEPSAVSRIVPIGQPVVLRAEILDQLDRPVRLAGEPVYLGQVIYGQQGLIFGEAKINQGQVGQTPVVAYTNGQGVATFTIRGTQASTDPVYFEANLVNARQFYPFGYSEIVPIRFGSGQ